MFDNQTVELSLWDTAGQEEFDRIRLLSYENTHVYMICFSVENRDSLQNIPDKWLDEITENGPHAKIVLVALKCDLRQEKRNAIQYEEVGRITNLVLLYNYSFIIHQGLEMAKSINAIRYLECSAKENRGVKECFQETAKVALSGKKKKKVDSTKKAPNLINNHIRSETENIA